MPATKTRSPKRAPGGARAPKTQAASLPPITVAKFEETGRLLERTVAENQAVFIEKGQTFKEQHRQGSSRPLTALEAAQIAASAGATDNVVGVAEEVQGSNLRAYEEPAPRDVLLAAGLGTAAGIVEAFRRAVALVEMPNDQFKQARENGQLDQAIDTAAADLEDITIGELKERTTAAMEHYATSAGFTLGEAMSLPVKAIWQALTNAIDSLSDGSPSSSLIDSAASTPGRDGPSSTS